GPPPGPSLALVPFPSPAPPPSALCPLSLHDALPIWFNAMLGALAVAILATGRFGDAMFVFVLVINSAIGIIQEVRAKRTLDRLAALHAPTATVLRDGALNEIPIGEVVLDDLIELTTGDQVPADGELSRSEGLEVDESNLTGESDPIAKAGGDEVLSGTAVVAGRGLF